MEVRVGRMPGPLTTYAVESGSTVNDVLKLARVNPKGFRIEVNDDTAELNDKVKNNSTILLTKSIQGN